MKTFVLRDQICSVDIWMAESKYGGISSQNCCGSSFYVFAKKYFKSENVNLHQFIPFHSKRHSSYVAVDHLAININFILSTWLGMKEISSMLLRGTLQPYGIKRSCSGMLSKESWIHFSNYILSSFSLLFLLNFKQGAARSHSNSYLEIDIFVFATLVYWHLAIMELFLRKAIWRSIKNHLGLSMKLLQLQEKRNVLWFQFNT